MMVHIETPSSFLHSHPFDMYSELLMRCMEETREQLTEKPPIVVYGKPAKQPRNVGFFSDESIGYKYSRQMMPSMRMTGGLHILLQIVNEKFGASFNGILINEYMNGDDNIGAHSDDEGSLDANGVVAISLGAVRKFRIRNKLTKEKVIDIPTTPFEILHMGGDFQKEFTHEIPVEKKVKTPRYSFTFRKHKE